MDYDERNNAKRKTLQIFIIYICKPNNEDFIHWNETGFSLSVRPSVLSVFLLLLFARPTKRNETKRNETKHKTTIRIQSIHQLVRNLGSVKEIGFVDRKNLLTEESYNRSAQMKGNKIVKKYFFSGLLRFCLTWQQIFNWHKITKNFVVIHKLRPKCTIKKAYESKISSF